MILSKPEYPIREIGKLITTIPLEIDIENTNIDSLTEAINFIQKSYDLDKVSATIRLNQDGSIQCAEIYKLEDREKYSNRLTQYKKEMQQLEESFKIPDKFLEELGKEIQIEIPKPDKYSKEEDVYFLDWNFCYNYHLSITLYPNGEFIWIAKCDKLLPIKSHNFLTKTSSVLGHLFFLAKVIDDNT